MPELANLKDKFEEKKLFIVGNGPSLNASTLNKIKNKNSLALNKINYIYDDTEWRPSFYLFIQSSMSDTDEEFIRENISLNIQCFINEDFSETFGEQENVHYITRKKLPADPLITIMNETGKSEEEITAEDAYKCWNDDISDGVYLKHSVLPQFQIASYLGFDEINLIGFDLGYEVQKPYMIFNSGLDPHNYKDKTEYIKESLEERLLLRSLVNGMAYKMIWLDIVDTILYYTTNLHKSKHHFDSEYVNEIAMRNRNIEHIHAHKIVHKIADDKNIQVFNATNGGELEVYQRIDLNTALQTNTESGKIS